MVIWVIEVHKKVWVNLSTLQVYLTINESLLERLQRIEWLSHSRHETLSRMQDLKTILT